MTLATVLAIVFIQFGLYVCWQLATDDCDRRHR